MGGGEQASEQAVGQARQKPGRRVEMATRGRKKPSGNPSLPYVLLWPFFFLLPTGHSPEGGTYGRSWDCPQMAKMGSVDVLAMLDGPGPIACGVRSLWCSNVQCRKRRSGAWAVRAGKEETRQAWEVLESWTSGGWCGYADCAGGGAGPRCVEEKGPDPQLTLTASHSSPAAQLLQLADQPKTMSKKSRFHSILTESISAAKCAGRAILQGLSINWRWLGRVESVGSVCAKWFRRLCWHWMPLQRQEISTQPWSVTLVAPRGHGKAGPALRRWIGLKQIHIRQPDWQLS